MSANGQRLTRLAQLQAIVEETPIGSEMTLLIDRGGQRIEVKVSPQPQPGPIETRGMPRSRIEGDGRRDPARERVRSRVVPARPAPESPSTKDSSEPSSLEPIPGVDRSPDRPVPAPVDPKTQSSGP